MSFIDQCDTVTAKLTSVARANHARSILGDVTFVMEGFALGRYGYDSTNPVKTVPIVDPTGVANADITIIDNTFDAGDKVTVKGEDFIVNVDWNAGGTSADSAVNLAAAINARLNMEASRYIFASAVTNTVYLYAIVPGSAGNSFTLSKNDHVTSNFNISGPLFTGGRDGCLGGSDGGLVDKIFPNTNPVSHLDVTSIRKFKISTGTHNGPTGNTLYDSTKSWIINNYTNEMITNVTAGSKGLVLSNTNTAMYCTLNGGNRTTWQYGDSYLIGIEQPNSTSVSALCRLSRTEGTWGYGEIATYAKIVKSNISYEVGKYFMYAIGHFPIIAKNNKQVAIFRVLTQF
jgi:hypothetical protein